MIHYHGTETGREMTVEEVTALHEMVVEIDGSIRRLLKTHPDLVGSALLTLATFSVEWIYLCSNSMEAANRLLSAAQETGLNNWIAEEERQQNAANEPQIIIPN